MTIMSSVLKFTASRPAVHVFLLRLLYVARQRGKRMPPPKIIYDKGWKAIDGDQVFALPAPQRGYFIVPRGITAAKDALAARYFPRGDIAERCSGKTVVDVGANIGIFTMAALDAGAKQVIAFEPDPFAFACLEKNVGNDPRVSLYPVMLNDLDGVSKLYVATSSGDSSMIPPPRHQAVISVDSRRLDSLTLSLADGDVLKIEAEGAEPEVLRGCVQTLRRARVFVTVRASSERQGRSTFADCAAILRSIEYQCKAGDCLVPPKQLLAEKRGESNGRNSQ